MNYIVKNILFVTPILFIGMFAYAIMGVPYNTVLIFSIFCGFLGLALGIFPNFPPKKEQKKDEEE